MNIAHDTGQRAAFIPREKKSRGRGMTQPLTWDLFTLWLKAVSFSCHKSRKNTQNLQSVTQWCEDTTKGWSQFHIHHHHQPRDWPAWLHRGLSSSQPPPLHHKCFWDGLLWGRVQRSEPLCVWMQCSSPEHYCKGSSHRLAIRATHTHTGEQGGLQTCLWRWLPNCPRNYWSLL